ncbi:unnamed protein product [Phytophthora fragariaefolia]|uniref:Unnamed protein product n=1 Tax=Phytophthora fragariaefolia TaxID=1490495 RepID=A0A9W6WXZ9_9STRA|nr:unnamed protein product [Phytophthora fragariaefolia]
MTRVRSQDASDLRCVTVADRPRTDQRHPVKTGPSCTAALMTLDAHTPMGWWTPADAIPRALGFIQLGSRRYQKRQNLAYGTTCDAGDVWVAEASSAPMVARLTYQTPWKVLSRDEERRSRPEASQRDWTPMMATIATAQNAGTKDRFNVGESAAYASKTHVPEPDTGTRDEEEEDAVLVHEGSDLCAEELEAEMAILPDLSLTAEVRIEDLKVGQPTGVDPEIYQRLIDNALYGFLRLSPENAARDVFEGGEPERPGTHSVLGRRSYIDDILIGGKAWDDLYEKVEFLLDVCEQWHLSISVEKSEWGMLQVDYLGHKVSQHGLQANMKNLGPLTTLEFPHALKGLQSFLNSLSYYHRFIPSFAVYATTMYALTESDFVEYETTPGVREQEQWRHALRAFEILKSKIATTPMLKDFDAIENRW